MSHQLVSKEKHARIVAVLKGDPELDVAGIRERWGLSAKAANALMREVHGGKKPAGQPRHVLQPGSAP